MTTTRRRNRKRPKRKIQRKKAARLQTQSYDFFKDSDRKRTLERQSHFLGQLKFDLEKYEKERVKVYWFPFYFRIVAWLICIVSILVSNFIIFFNHENVGEERTKLWLSCVFILFVLTFFVIEPTKIVIYSFILNKFGLRPAEVHKPIEPQMFYNAADREKLKDVRLYRISKAEIYTPPNQAHMRKRKAELVNLIQMEMWLVDNILLILLVTSVVLLVAMHREGKVYYGNRTVKDLIVKAHYTKSIPFLRIINHDQFIEYLNETLIPALLVNDSAWNAVHDSGGNHGKEKEKPEHRMLTPEMFYRKTGNGSAGRRNGTFERTFIFDRAFTREPLMKLVGTVRLRQKRVRAQVDCFVPNISTVLESRFRRCATFLDLVNEDKEHYLIGWTKESEHEPSGSDVLKEPWTYRSASENSALHMPGRMRKDVEAGGSGYVIHFGKNVQNARYVLDFLNYFNWIDAFTRMLFVELTLYCADTNLFHMVTLVVDVTSTGRYIPSYKIQSNELFRESSVQFLLSTSSIVLFGVMIFFHAIRETLKMRRVNLRSYFTEGWSVMDLILVFIGFGFIAIYVSRIVLVGYVSEEMNIKHNKEFISFGLVSYFCRLEEYFLGVLNFITVAKFSRSLTIYLAIWEWERVIRDSGRSLFAICFVIIYIVFVVAAYMYLVYGRHDENFSNVWNALSMQLGHLVDRTHDSRPLMHLGPIFGAPVYVSSLIFVHIALVHSIEMVLAVHHKIVSHQPLTSYYKVGTYVKSLYDSSVKVPAPPTTPLPMPVALRQQRAAQFRPPRWVDEARLQGLKRVTLTMLKGWDPMEAIALNIIYLALTDNVSRPATDKYNLVQEKGKNTLVGELKVKDMKHIADKVVEQRNIVVKNKLTVGSELTEHTKS